MNKNPPSGACNSAIPYPGKKLDEARFVMAQMNDKKAKMILTDGKETCRRCRRKPSVIYRDGRVKALCPDCRFFTLGPEGCGSAHAKTFCEPCIDSIWINSYGGKTG
jgi:hypothetical protein